MGFFKKIGKGLKKVGRKLKRGVKKLGQNVKKYGPKLLQIGSMFIPGMQGAGGLLGKVFGGGGGGFLSKVMGGGGGGFLGKMFGGGGGGGGGGFFKRAFGGGLGQGTGLFGKAGGFMSGQGGLSNMFGGGGGGLFSKIGGGGKMGKFGDWMKEKAGGWLKDKAGGLLSSAMGGGMLAASPDLNYDIQSIRNQYAPSSAKANELEKYYKDLADPNSAMNKKIQQSMMQGSMDQAAMGELQAERRMGGATTGMQREGLTELYDDASERGAGQFSNYMLGQTGQAGRGLASTLPYWQQIDNEAASLGLANQQHGFQQDMQKYGAINQIGGGLLDYGMESMFPQKTNQGAYHGPYPQNYYN